MFVGLLWPERPDTEPDIDTFPVFRSKQHQNQKDISSHRIINKRY